MKRPLAILLLVIMVLPPTARAGQVAARGADAVGAAAPEQLDLMVGRSAIIRTERPITRVSLSTPDIADAVVTTPYELLVHGKIPGTISLLLWSDNGRIKTYDVAVKRDLSNLETQLKKLFPGEAITAASNGKDVVLSGVVSSKYIVDRASSLALGYVEKADNVVNLLRQQEGPATNQILLRVRFAEVGRSAMQELGVNFFTGPNGKGDWVGRSTTGQFAAPVFDRNDGLVFSDFLNLFLFNTEEQLGAAIRALKGKGLFQSLAEPNLITRDGQEATFLAGGEYPYPVVQGNGNNNAVTIVFKEFGVRLRFTPTVTADDRIQLKVAPEVSSLDFGNAVVLEGFRIPALKTRRTETSVELRDGQTFAIAGMLDQNLDESLRRVPGIGDIPILGYLFRSQAYQKSATELVVMITPHIVRRDSPGVTPNLPGLVQPFLEPHSNRIAPPPPAFTSPMTFAPESAPVVAKPASPAASQTATTAQPFATTPAAPMPVAPLAVASASAQGASADKPAAFNTPAGPTKAEREAAARDARKAAELAAQIERKRAEQAAVQEKKDAEQAKKDEAKRREEEKKEAEIKRKQDEIAAKEAHVQAQRDGERARSAAKVEAERLERERKEKEIERKAAEKLAAQQQAEAERVKEAADRLAKEKASRDAELQRLVTQYQKLTEGQQTSGR